MSKRISGKEMSHVASSRIFTSSSGVKQSQRDKLGDFKIISTILLIDSLEISESQRQRVCTHEPVVSGSQ